MQILRNALVVLLVVVSVALLERIVWWGKVLPGVSAPHSHIAGHTRAGATQELSATAKRLESTPITAKAGTVSLSVDPKSLNYKVDARATMQAARRAGRDGNPVAQLSGVFLRRVRNDNVGLVVHFDQSKVADTVDTWATQIDKGLINGNLKFQGTTVIPVEPHRGTGLRKPQAQALLIQALRTGDRQTFKLPVGQVDPDVNTQDVQQAAEEARKLLHDPITVNIEGGQFTISPEQLARSLTTKIEKRKLKLAIDTSALHAALGSAVTPFETASKEASFTVSGTSVSVVPSTSGRAVNLAAIVPAVLRGERTVSADIKNTEPKHNTAWAQKLNITQLVSSFTTQHPAGQERVKNIHLAANIMNNTIVEPGETFSLNQALGKRTPERGFVKAPVFSTDNGFFEDYGGGVSQFTTTFYNAVFFGGYKDVAHTPHSIYISRYPMGREATLNYGSIDLKFKDDSNSGILVRTSYTGTSITVTLYGNKEGRTVRAEGPNILEQTPIDTEYVDDPTLPQGVEKEMEKGYPGIKVENFRIISRPGQPDKRERYAWTYDMVKRKVARGTGATTSTAPAAPGTTAAPTTTAATTTLPPPAD